MCTISTLGIFLFAYSLNFFSHENQGIQIREIQEEAKIQENIPKKIEIQKTTALFFGDVMLDRYIRQTLDKHGWEYILDASMKAFMNSTDITAINFEGAMTENKPYTAHDMMLSFTSDPKWAKNMKEYGITIASLANNHSLNFGHDGFTDTKKFLKAFDIETFGTPYNKESVGNLSIIQEIKGMKIGFIAYHELFSGNTSPIIQEIEKIKDDTDFIVIYAHWGDEYKQIIHPRPQKKAHEFIDHGADLVIGHHPHVVQPMETYKGKYIFYSLGNFIFDQKTYTSVKRRLALQVTFTCQDEKIPEKTCTNKTINYSLFPMISNEQYQVRLMNSEERETFFTWFENISK